MYERFSRGSHNAAVTSFEPGLAAISPEQTQHRWCELINECTALSGTAEKAVSPSDMHGTDGSESGASSHAGKIDAGQ